MRTALLVPDEISPWTPPLHEAVRAEFSADVYPVPRHGPIPDLRSYDLVISRLKFRHLAAMGRIDWGGTDALKVHWDEDGFWDGLWSDPRRRGMWSQALPGLAFDVLAVTGLRTQQYFEERGFRTIVVHKGFDEGFFRDDGLLRETEIIMYGQDYLSRALARQRLGRAGIPVRSIKVPFEQLARELGTSLAALSCTLDAEVIGGRRMEWIARAFPSAFIRTSEGPEPMLKFFECAASGCATFTDYSPDLEELGFVDGENVIVFRDVDELVEKARAYFQEPDEMRRIGSRGAELCRQRHGWRTRARELRTRLGSIIL